MTVYVDDMYKYPIGQFTRMKMSHMIADTDEELHAMADTIGLSRQWWQAPPRFDSHYDVALSRRVLAVKAGAVEVSLRQLAAMVRVRRITGTLPTPEEAQERMLQLFAERQAARETGLAL